MGRLIPLSGDSLLLFMVPRGIAAELSQFADRCRRKAVMFLADSNDEDRDTDTDQMDGIKSSNALYSLHS